MKCGLVEWCLNGSSSFQDNVGRQELAVKGEVMWRKLSRTTGDLGGAEAKLQSLCKKTRTALRVAKQEGESFGKLIGNSACRSF